MKNQIRNIIIGALAALACALPCSLSASTITVTSTADDGSTGTLRTALFSASDGDIIDATGLSGTITLTNGQLAVPASVTILGPGPGNLAVDGNGSNRVFYVWGGRNVTIAGLTITNGKVTGSEAVGGGIYNDHAALTVSNCVISGNSADVLGGGILNNGFLGTASLSVIACTITSNSCFSASYGGGAGIYNDGAGSGNATALVDSSTITDNSSGWGGGGIYNDGAIGTGTLTIVNSIVNGNSATGFGGGIFNDGYNGSGTVAVSNCVVSGNSAAQDGGGLFSAGDNGGNGTLSAITSTISSNSASSGSGGGIYNNGATGTAMVSVSNCTVSGNSAGVYGGGLYNDGKNSGNAVLSVNECNISGNTAADNAGGGIYNDATLGHATLSVTSSTISSNVATTHGGGIYNDGDTGHAMLLVTNCTISGNVATADGGGGGIANFGYAGDATATVVGTTISGNTSDLGAGIYNSGYKGSTMASVRTSTISGNQASFAGGAIYNQAYQGQTTLDLIGSTLSGNSSGTTGGAIVNHGASGNSTNRISGCTFSGNLATGGASSIYNDGSGGNALLQIGDTILNDATPSNNVVNYSGTFVSAGYNLANDCGVIDFFGNSCGLGGTGDIVNTDPKLGPLQDNGGPTWTHALSPCSPAVDQGKTNTIEDLALSTDQRGATRPVDISSIADAAGGDGSDIGAFELQTAEADACSITCPGNQTFENDPGLCGAIVHYIEPTVCGTCATVTCSPTNGSLFSIGTNTVICMTNGVPICSFTVTVRDVEAPTISSCAPPLTNSANASGQSTVPDFTGSVVASDNCTAANALMITQVPAPGTTVGMGTTNITIYVVDAVGNSTSCSTHLTVVGADLSLGMSALKSSAKGNTFVTYTLTVTNLGPRNATNVVVTNVVPSGTVFTSASTTNGTFTTPAVGSTGTVRWSVGNMISGAKAPAQIQVTVNVKGNKDITNTATVTSDTADPNRANNTATVVTPTKGK